MTSSFNLSFIFVNVEEEPLLRPVEASILALMAFIILSVGLIVQVLIVIIVFSHQHTCLFSYVCLTHGMHGLRTHSLHKQWDSGVVFPKSSIEYPDTRVIGHFFNYSSTRVVGSSIEYL